MGAELSEQQGAYSSCVTIEKRSEIGRGGTEVLAEGQEEECSHIRVLVLVPVQNN